VELNVALVVEAVAGAVPDREAVVWRDRRLGYAPFVERCRRLASVLHGAGLGAHGDPAAAAPHESAQDLVLLLMTNCPEYLEGMVGGYLARVGPANVNYRYTAAEVAYLVGDSGARAAIVHRRFAALLPDLDVLLVVEDGSGAAVPPGARSYEEALASAPAVELDEPTPDDLYVVYTGGTTGRPKGVLWRQADFLAGALGVTGTYDSIAGAAAAAPADRLRTLPAPPLMHGAAHWNAISCLAAGGTVVLPDRPEHFDVDDVLATIERERCTSLNIVGDAFGIPLADALERAEPPRDVSCLRHVVTGGAVLSATTKERLTKAVPGLRVVDIVGSSESGRQGVASGTGAGTFRRSGDAVVLDDDRRRVLAVDDPSLGWLATTGPIPRGYLGDPAKTAETFPVLGGVRYVVAGDRARWSADGSGEIELLGRESATINTGGEKVFAEEVEAAVRAHPAVADAIVVGRPSPRWGAEVVAVVALRDDVGDDVGDDELRAACAATLARYKLPRAFVRVDAVQRTPSGKSDYAWARSVVTGSP
jgi:acyl-CoA synthetase (AMP-forming)/AMP-acid ligase II